MKDFYINSNSQEESYDYSNITSSYYDYYDFSNDDYNSAEIIMYALSCIIPSVGLPLTLVAIYALYSQVQNDHVAPIYIINLLISDLIQFFCMIVEVATTEDQMINIIGTDIYIYCLMASVGFMMCVALERYLVIACPLWYRFRRTIKISVVVCVLVWIFPLVFVLIIYSCVDFETIRIFGVFFLLPLPLFIFFLGGTLKALSASRVPSDEKRRIVGVLVLVLLIYTLLFLPSIIVLLGDLSDITLDNVSYICVQLSPLADLTLYVFMRKGTIDKLLASVCSCRVDSSDNDTSISSV